MKYTRDGNILKLAFDERTSESHYYEIDTDKPESNPVFVSVQEEGVEIIQTTDSEMNVVFLTDGQLQGVLQVFAVEALGANDDGQFDFDFNPEGSTYQ